jgi:hypothetical protein
MNDFRDAHAGPSDGGAVRLSGRIRPAPENTLSADELERGRRARLLQGQPMRQRVAPKRGSTLNRVASRGGNQPSHRYAWAQVERDHPN